VKTENDKNRSKIRIVVDSVCFLRLEESSKRIKNETSLLKVVNSLCF
jgi:hypothetical protein